MKEVLEKLRLEVDKDIGDALFFGEYHNNR